MTNIVKLVSTGIRLAVVVGCAAAAWMAQAEDLAEKAKQQARSVHLWYSPMQKDAESVVGTVKVTETQPDSYFMVVGWNGGYSGIQDVRGGHWMIFSVWDAVDMESFKGKSEEEREQLRAQILYSDPDVETARFGGEGTGARTMANIGWKVGEPVRLRIDAEPCDGDRTAYTCNLYDFKKGTWKKIATISTPNHGKGCKRLNGIYSFIEDFRRNYKSAEVSRRAEYSDFASRAPGSDKWVPATAAYFAGDQNPSMRVDGGLSDDNRAFFLQTGGNTTNSHVKIMSTIKLPTPMKTVWGEKVTPENAWRGYPRPQLVRAEWTNLNGLWKYAVSPKAEEARTLPSEWQGEILVPFAIESPLSGVGRRMAPDELLWYRRTIDVRKRPGERTLLHFGGVDFRAQVFVNRTEVTDVPHEGGQAPFTLDVTDFVKDGENTLTVCAWDPTTDFIGTVGKQSFNPGGCFYTRSSGIWQTVWMENVAEAHVTGYQAYGADLAKGTVKVVVDGVDTPAARRAGLRGTVTASFGGKELAKAEFVFGEEVTLQLPTPVKTWSPDAPQLYDLDISYGKDAAKGYFAMRRLEKRRDVNGIWRFYLNGEPCFLQGPLDQGWWPDGLLTPPSDDAMRFDIQTLKDLGFNMMRKHIKVEPARYYWLCDTMGMMVLQDMPSSSVDMPANCGRNARYGMYRREFKEVVDAIAVFPSIVMWIPYNEGWGQPGELLTHCSQAWVRRYDRDRRLVNTASGWSDYERGHEEEQIAAWGQLTSDSTDMHNYRGPGMFPVDDYRVSFLGEFGGLGQLVKDHLWNPKAGNWGYGGTKDTATREGLMKVYAGLMERLAICARNGLGGSVYTQTTDVETESNGYLTYDRKVMKFDVPALRKLHEAVYAATKLAATRKVVRTSVFPRGSEWAYCDAQPSGAWQAAAYDDSAWKRAKGGFGAHAPGPRPNSAWTTSGLWARRHFAFDGMDDTAEAVLEMFHDEDAEVYVNGEKVFEVAGYNVGYEFFTIDRARFLKAVRKGDNVIAVHVKQTIGGQFFDAGLLLERME